MDDFWVGVTSATWLGVLTSISPCPLATNIAAISYIGKQVDRPCTVLLTGAMYTLGRAFTYMILGALLVASLLSVPGLSISPALYEQAARPDPGSGRDVSARPVAPTGNGWFRRKRLENGWVGRAPGVRGCWACCSPCPFVRPRPRYSSAV